LTVTGIGMAFIWSPLAATATRNLPGRLAGAGSGVYNSTRQVGAVLGSACLAAFMTWRISAEMPPTLSDTADGEGVVAQLPAYLRGPFAEAMSQTLLLPAFFALFGVVAALFLMGFSDRDSSMDDDDDLEDVDRDAGYAVEYGGDEAWVDDDDYVEYTVAWDEPEPGLNDAEGDTQPLRSRADPVLHAPGSSWHWEPQPPPKAQPQAPEPAPPARPERAYDDWRSILDQLMADVPPVPAKPAVEPIGFAHNGFHVDDDRRFQRVDKAEPLAEPRSPEADAYSADVRDSELPTGSHSRHHRRDAHERPSRHQLSEEQPEPRPFWFQSNGRHSRDDPDDTSRDGRHSMPWRD
jgi:hypothetical protein